MKRWWQAVLRVLRLAPITLFVGLMWVGACLGLGSWLAGLLPGDLRGQLAPVIMGLLALAGYSLFVRVLEARPVIELYTRRAPAELGAGLALGALLFSATVAGLALLGVFRITGVNGLAVVLPVLLQSLGTAVLEELMLRGLVFRLVESWLGSWAALALSALLFGALHLGNPHADLVSAVAIALEAGVMLAAAYMLTRSLWLPIGIHAAWNFTQGGVFGVATSGVAIQGYFQTELSGPVLLSGGEFGAEASLVAVLVCTAAGLALLSLARGRGQLLAPRWRRAR